MSEEQSQDSRSRSARAGEDSPVTADAAPMKSARASQADTVIEPVSYRHEAEEDRRRIPISPLQITLIAIAIPVLLVLWFLFTAKSVRLEFIPVAEHLEVHGGLSFELGGVYLLRRGDYDIRAQSEGYYPLSEPIEVGVDRNQTFSFEFQKLPGLVTFTSTPEGATVTYEDVVLGVTPTEPTPVAAGPQRVEYSRDRYQTTILDIDVVGLNQSQTVTGELKPDWADVTVTSLPEGAEIFIDDAPTGLTTPAVVELLTGEHEIRLKAKGHRSHRQRILVAALDQLQLPMVALVKADGLVTVRTRPSGAGVTLNGQFRGESPVEVAVQSGRSYRLQVFKAGFAPRETSVRLDPGEERNVSLDLAQLTGQLVIRMEPADAELSVNGRKMGRGNQTLTLPTQAQRLEINKEGYAGFSSTITPKNGLVQEVKVRLLTLAEARLAALKPQLKTSQGQTLVLMSPSAFTMGASRREPGRRANETLREVDMERLFYLATTEVTNLQFRAFASGHDSGKFQEYELGKDEHPVVNVSWNDAALYCNWLSDKDRLPRFYRTDLGKVVGVNPAATGYRMPTEAEWAWSARQLDDNETATRFPWGPNLPPPDRHGNYADHSASNLVGRVIFGYNDNYITSAPVGTFTPTRNGIFDLSGNVAEWVHDFYEISEATPAKDPLGPDDGDYHVIRGSSWMQGTITDLRISFRDYGTDGRQDVGFRIARFAEST